MKAYKVVLLDFDGVLGKTMEDNYEAWAYSFEQYSINLKKQEYFLLEGLPTKELATQILKRNGMDSSFVSHIVEEKEKHYKCHHSFELYPGVQQLFDVLKENDYLVGVVSGGTSKRLLSCGIDNLLECLNVRITGDMVSQGKPAPDPYLKAAEFLKVLPIFCLVIENAPLGIESAKKAGMDCIAISSTLGKKYLQQADRIVENILEVSDILAKGGFA